MELMHAVSSLSAQAQPSRMEVIRLLVQTELIDAQRDGRSIIYRVRVEGSAG